MLNNFDEETVKNHLSSDEHHGKAKIVSIFQANEDIILPTSENKKTLTINGISFVPIHITTNNNFDNMNNNSNEMIIPKGTVCRLTYKPIQIFSGKTSFPLYSIDKLKDIRDGYYLF